MPFSEDCLESRGCWGIILSMIRMVGGLLHQTNCEGEIKLQLNQVAT